MKLTDEQLARVKDNLCSYDSRSPCYDEENGKRVENCYCDCCFYGNTWLAELILINVKEQ